LRRIVPIVAADPAATLASIVPIYEFECSNCGSRFEELVADSEARRREREARRRERLAEAPARRTSP
jgi:predicted nucleic acid-binding Zn ribbon protein